MSIMAVLWRMKNMDDKAYRNGAFDLCEISPRTREMAAMKCS